MKDSLLNWYLVILASELTAIVIVEITKKVYSKLFPKKRRVRPKLGELRRILP